MCRHALSYWLPVSYWRLGCWRVGAACGHWCIAVQGLATIQGTGQVRAAAVHTHGGHETCHVTETAIEGGGAGRRPDRGRGPGALVGTVGVRVAPGLKWRDLHRGKMEGQGTICESNC